MALSGTIYGTTGNQYVDCKVVWTAEQDIENNKSEITATLYYSRTNTGYETYGKFIGGLTINGMTFENEEYITVSYSSNTVAVSGVYPVAHNADGSKTCAVSAYGYIRGTSVDATYLSGTITLDEIAQQATITSAENFTDEENPTITYLNKAGNAVSSLQACISFDGSNPDVPYRDIPKTGTRYTFNLTEYERDVLRSKFPTTNGGNVRFYVKTVLGGKNYYSSLTKTFSIVNANPIMSPTAVDVDATTLALTGNSNRFIKYYSDVKADMNAESVKKTGLVSYKITCGGKSSTKASATLTNVESGNVVFTATDERGNSTTQTLKKTLVPYVKLTCNLTPTTPTTSGDMTLTINGNYYNGSFGAVNNTLTLQYRMKENTNAYGNWITITPTITGNTYNFSLPITGLDYQSQYIFQARAIDKLATKTTPEKGVKTTPVFDWGKNDFNFNVPVNFPKGYKKPNAILWTGENYMNATQSINLPSLVSEQPNGIVLVFSNYDPTTSDANNYDWHCFFVPKKLVEMQDGTGHTFNMMSQAFGDIASKYIYIGDRTISGHEVNTTNGTRNGITYNNAKYVLRYVLGV